MQPPPRKGNYAKFLKSLHGEQINKLQIKNQYECELLEDIRNFTKQRSAIEKSYAEALLKISSVYLNKKIPNIPDIKLEGGEERWNMWNVWRTVLEENEKLARARLAAVEVFQQSISDDAKILRAHKMQNARKCMDNLQVVQKELQTTVQDVDRHKKLYFDEEYSAHDVRDKAKDIEEKLKKKKGSFFTSITSLQKNSAKFSSKREICDQRSTGARNDYLLSIAAANAHQTRYFVVDFQNTLLTMESHVFERVQEYLTLIGRTELLTCSATQTSFTRIRDQANKLTREYNLQCCYLFFPVLKQHIQYEFEPCCEDPIDKVTVSDPNSSAAAAIIKETKRLCAKIGRESINIRECSRKLQALLIARDAGQKTDPNDPNGPDIDIKIEELRQLIRRSETSKAKTEARIECLKNGGVNVEEYMQDVENLSTLELPRSSSALSVRTDASGQEQASSDSFYDDSDCGDGEITAAERAQAEADQKRDEEREMQDAAEVEAMMEAERAKIEEMTAAWDDPTSVDWGHEEEEAMAAAAAEALPSTTGDDEPSYKCVALYNYTAQNPDELSIVEGEQLDVLAGADYDAGEGWLRARNMRGDEGFVPQNYLDFPEEGAEQTANGAEVCEVTVEDQSPSQQEAAGISFSSVDYTVEEEEQALQEYSGPTGPAPTLASQPQVVKSGSIERRDAPPPLNLARDGTGPQYCIAMYDYEATAPEELTFEEGTIIRIIRRDVHAVDDGWWEGEMINDDGETVTGLFPSLVIQECGPDGEPFSGEEGGSPPGSAPPVFTPPDVPSFLLAPQDVIVTQPTPETGEVPDGLQEGNNRDGPFVEEMENEDEAEEMAFTSKLKRSQDEQRQRQNGDIITSATNGKIPPSVPTVCIELHEEDGDADEEEDEMSEGKKGDADGLGSAQIIITAATPMSEEPDHPFPPPPEQSQNDSQSAPPAPPQQEKGEEELSEMSAAETPQELETEEASSSEQPTEIEIDDGSSSVTSATPPHNTYSHQQATQKQQPAHEMMRELQDMPDELELQQLAKLSTLKESDA